MGVTNEGTFFPVSTGAVEGPPEVVEHVQAFDGAPTGEVDGPPKEVTAKFGPSGLKSTNTVEIPKTVTYTNTSVKVVNAPDREQAKGATTAETEASTNTESTRTQKAHTESTGAGGN